MRGRRARGADGPPRQASCGMQTPYGRSTASSRRDPRLLALVGDSADGYPGIDGIGEVTARRFINRYGAIEDFPPEVLGERRELALLFKRLGDARTDAPLFSDVEALRWRGPTEGFEAWAARIGDARLLARSRRMVDSVH